MYRIILVPCLISCSANSPCPAMRDGPTLTRIFTRGCLLVDAEVLPVLSLLDSAAPNIGILMGRRTALPGGVDQRGYRVWDSSGCRRVYSILILLSPQGSAKNCCPSLCVLVVYICSLDTYVHYSQLIGWRSVVYAIQEWATPRGRARWYPCPPARGI